MKEEYLHYLFRMRLLGQDFKTVDGRALHVLDTGTYNTDAGPDFLSARIRLDDKTWVGPVEFHIRSSDWYQHRHQQDARYNNVIAHFVFEHDRDVYSGNYLLPTIELKSKTDPVHYQRYLALAESRDKIPCENSIAGVDPLIVFQQKERALANRMTRKSAQILSDIHGHGGDLQKALYLSMARVFGGKVNSAAFEKLVSLIDLRQLQKYRNNPSAIPSILFGVSGLLPEQSTDGYVRELIHEFGFQRHRLSLPVMEASEWRYSRMLPYGFPDIRIAQFSALIAADIDVAGLIGGQMDIDTIYHTLQLEIPDFWKTHYRFENRTRSKEAGLSIDFRDLLIINALAPFLFARGLYEDNQQLKEKALDWLSALRPEKNGIVRTWAGMGITCGTAFDSQALIEQKNEFCSAKKCLFCSIGTKLLRA